MALNRPVLVVARMTCVYQRLNKLSYKLSELLTCFLTRTGPHSQPQHNEVSASVERRRAMVSHAGGKLTAISSAL